MDADLAASSASPLVEARPAVRRATTLLQRWARNAVLGRLGGLRDGRLSITDQDGRYAFGDGGRLITVTISDPAMWCAIAGDGTVGAGTAYAAGQWTCDDLPALIRLIVCNRETLDGLEGGLARIGMAIGRMLHRLRRNTRTGSRRNIAAHYDLGNDFYRAWLDPTLMYSSALFLREDMTLHEAQLAKLDRLCDLLELSADDHLLEIGTGWGGLAIHAAQRHGCRVTTTTISRQQYDLARERVRAAGLDGRVTVLLQDYRDLTGIYDKVVSVEMIEAVGHQYYDTYFATINRLLKPTGLAVIQAITIAERRYQAALKEVDFIQRCIFPGATIPSLGALTAAIGRSSDLDVIGMQDHGADYERTLRIWRETFLAARARIAALGYDAQFQRLWEFYLAYCEGGFAERALGLAHLRLARHGWRPRRPAEAAT